jgi:hypothetical protein
LDGIWSFAVPRFAVTIRGESSESHFAAGHSRLRQDLFLEPLPLAEVVALLDQSNEDEVRFRVRKDTDYAELVSWTGVLGTCLSDVVVYHKSQPTQLEAVITHLDQMHSAIRT